jgi:catechol 2,3-dioxygenase
MKSRKDETPDFDIIRTSHVEFFVTDLEKSREFYVDTLGFIETESDQSHLYLRGLEDRFHHCIVLSKSSKPGIGHIAFRVRQEEDLKKIAELFQQKKLRVKWLESGEERGQGRALRAQDEFGFPVEFFNEMSETEWMLRKFDMYSRARIMRIDHVNLHVPNVAAASDWYMKKLGFACSEYTETDGPKRELWATWLRRKPNVHDVALMAGRGPRLHHTGVVVSEKDNILDCADIMASKGLLKNLERGPGRHGISNAFFLYIRDPDGHRVELYTGDYLTVDPGWKPIRWSLSDSQRQTFWGAPAPESWFNEAMEVNSVFTGELIPTEDPPASLRIYQC